MNFVKFPSHRARNTAMSWLAPDKPKFYHWPLTVNRSSGKGIACITDAQLGILKAHEHQCMRFSVVKRDTHLLRECW